MKRLIKFLTCNHTRFKWERDKGGPSGKRCLDCGAFSPVLTVLGRWRLT